MKSQLKYRICEFSPAASGYLNCVASFQYVADVIGYLMFNYADGIVLVRRNTKGQWINLSLSTLKVVIDSDIHSFSDKYGTERVNEFLSVISGNESES